MPTVPLAGERVGVAAAVTPQASSKPLGGEMRTVKIGKAVVHDERIATSDTGVVQVLLLDGSTFTVGPSSNLVIDKFVYDPATGAGELAASFSKGALRFVGGKLSKTEPGVKVNTPAGLLTVRGGIFQGIVESANRAVFAFVSGHYLSLDRGGRRYTLRATGNLFAIGKPGASILYETTAADTNLILAAVSGQSFGTKLYKIKDQGQALAVLLQHPAVGALFQPALHLRALFRQCEPHQAAPRAGADAAPDERHEAGRHPLRELLEGHAGRFAALLRATAPGPK